MTTFVPLWLLNHNTMMLSCIVMMLLVSSTLAIHEQLDLPAIKESDMHLTSCINLPDGEHYIRPTDNAPSILVRCSAGWAILDYSLDANILKYFSSFMQVDEGFFTMDVSSEHLNWDEWLQIENVTFSVAEDCSVCDDRPDSPTGYYMTGNYFGCAFATKALCDMDPNTLDCYQCSTHDTSSDSNDTYPGLCTHIALDLANEQVDRSSTVHDKCTTYKWNFLPSLSQVGRYCTCFKPMNPDTDTWLDAHYVQSAPKKGELPPDAVDERVCDLNNLETVHLRNEDFLDGTYRIRKCGIYKLMHNIELNMNAPAESNIGEWNDAEELHWVPSEAQRADVDQYPSYNFIGAFSMGFFAGISVEADDVTIDLNGFELKMHNDFYLQQRFFSLIELASKPFISGQGPSNFGYTNVHYAKNVVIKNGILGLTSHHGIHGNNNENVVIRDVRIRDFEVAGLSINGFNGLSIVDIEIGPNYQNVPVSSMYTHARFMMQRLAAIEDRDAQSVIINGNTVPLNDIIDELQSEMNDALHFAHARMADHQFEVAAESHIAENMYINIDGLPHGGTLYGMFLNSFGASVFGLGLAPGKSTDLRLANVHIHGLRNRPIETIRYKLNRGPFNDLLDIARITDADGHYTGTSYSNAQYALSALVPDNWWSVLGHTYLDAEVREWIASADGAIDLRGVQEDGTPNVKCNSDVMVHLTKGIIGLRMDNVEGFSINENLTISSLHNLGAVGESELCAEYYASKDENDGPYPEGTGYTGTEVHGISFIGSTGNVREAANIQIDDLLSAHGSAYGINFYADNGIRVNEAVKIRISDVHAAAADLDVDEQIRGEPTPISFPIPRACGIDLGHSAEVHFGSHAQLHCVSQYESARDCASDLESAREMIETDNAGCRIMDADGRFVGLERSAREFSSHHESRDRLLLVSRQADTVQHIQIVTSQVRLFKFTVYLAIVAFVLFVSFLCSKLKNVWAWIKARSRRQTTDGRFEYEEL